MPIEIKPIEDDVESKVLRLFLKTIELLGGPRKLVEYRNLTWLPTLMLASYAVVYHKDKHYPADHIAKVLGISTTTARNILQADETIAMERIKAMTENKEVSEEKKTHMAGALAKIAYREIMQGKDEINLMMHLVKETSKSLGAEWAVKILSMLKGADFPLTKENLLARLKGVKIRGVPIEEIAKKLSYPIHTPAELLRKIKGAVSE